MIKRSVFLNLPACSTGSEQRHALLQAVEVAGLAERLHYSGIWLTEHHSASGGATPLPEILLAAMAIRTSCLRIGTSARLAGLADPKTLAEVAAMLDALSGGRFELGLARGYDTRDFEAVGRRIPDVDQLVDIAHTIRDLLNSDTLYPHPIQRPVPVALAASSKSTLLRAGGARFAVQVNPYFKESRHSFASELAEYRKCAGDAVHVFAHLLVYAAPSDAAASTDGLPVMDRYLRRYATDASFTACGLVEKGLAAVGSPETIGRTIDWLESIGVSEVGLNPMLGFHSASGVRRTLELLTTHQTETRS